MDLVFAEHVADIERSSKFMSIPEQLRIEQWVGKLRAMPTGFAHMDSAMIRNGYSGLLYNAVRAGSLVDPFTSYPPVETLPPLRQPMGSAAPHSTLAPPPTPRYAPSTPFAARGGHASAQLPHESPMDHTSHASLARPAQPFASGDPRQGQQTAGLLAGSIESHVERGWAPPSAASWAAAREQPLAPQGHALYGGSHAAPPSAPHAADAGNGLHSRLLHLEAGLSAVRGEIAELRAHASRADVDRATLARLAARVELLEAGRPAGVRETVQPPDSAYGRFAAHAGLAGGGGTPQPQAYAPSGWAAEHYSQALVGVPARVVRTPQHGYGQSAHACVMPSCSEPYHGMHAMGWAHQHASTPGR